MEKVCSFIREHQMLPPGERAVAGISGGADSVCLLFVLLEWRRRYGLEFAAVHVNHGIRREASEDADFVRRLCEKQDVPFYLKEADVPGLAADRKCSPEEAGRICRYQAFSEAAADFGADRIAVAHNLNDCCETMLFHLFRGSGVRGLTGILPVRDNVIRPLLCVERAQIEDYLAAAGQDFCRDATNDTDEYTRNRIRHHILPYAEREIAPGCMRHMAQTAELLAQTEDYLEQQTRAAVEQSVSKKGGEDCPEGYALDCGIFSSFHPSIQRRVLYELARALAPGARDIARVHVECLLDLFAVERNRRICLPFGIQGRREYGKVILERLEPGAGEISSQSLQGFRVGMKVFSVEDLPGYKENSLIFPQNIYTKWFDYDKIEKCPILRTRAPGDYLTIRGAEGEMRHKKIQDYMVTEKIPPGVRERIPVLAEDSHVLWIVGYRISEYYKVSGNTKRVLQVQLLPEDSTEEKNGGAYQSPFAGSGSGGAHTRDR